MTSVVPVINIIRKRRSLTLFGLAARLPPDVSVYKSCKGITSYPSLLYLLAGVVLGNGRVGQGGRKLLMILSA